MNNEVPREKRASQNVLPALAEGNRPLCTGCTYFFSDRKNENSQGGKDSRHGGSGREGKAREKKKKCVGHSHL